MASLELSQKHETLPVVMVAGVNPVHLISMAYTLDTAMPFRVFESDDAVQNIFKYKEFLLYFPSDALKKKLEKTHKYVALSRVWRMTPRSFERKISGR